MESISSFEYDEKNFYGTWRIKKSDTLSDEDKPPPGNENELNGTEMILEENCDVRWKIPSNVESIPLFTCESYEVILTTPAQLTFVSSSIGRIGPFAAEFSSLDKLQLTYDKAFILFCEKVPQAEQIQEAPFSFLPALEKGYFSDLVVTSSSGKNYHVHRVIMKLACPEQKWLHHSSSSSSKSSSSNSRSYQSCILDGLSDLVLSTVLHYLYCEALPSSLSESGARECLTAIAKIRGLEKLYKLCECYLENHAVKTKIEHLCDEVESSGRNIIKLLNSQCPPGDIAEPAMQLSVIKMATLEFAVAVLKVMQLCKLFSDHRNELSREERHKLMKYCRSRLPELLEMCGQFFEIVLSQLNKHTPNTRNELADCILLEIGPLFDVTNSMIVEIRQALETIMNADHGKKYKHKRTVVTWTLWNAVHIKELAKLRRFHTEVVEFIRNFMTKRDHFARLMTEDQLEAISNIVECAADEIPVTINRISNLKDNLDERLSWTQWKYFFKMGTAKVAWIIEKLRNSRQAVSSTLQTLRKLVHRDDFDAGLAALGLIDNVGKAVSTSREGKTMKTSQDRDSLSIPPVPRDSLLSSRSEELFKDLDNPANFLDMKFIVHYNKDGEPTTEIIQVHRVVVACRCDWFRRALLSGMIEDINREINVHDCHPEMFRHFLRYLYTGRLDCSDITIDGLADMIALADQYEMDSLKFVCEGALKPAITADNVLVLLSVGDQYNAASLRECCMEYVLEHNSVLESDVFTELPPRLQAEIKDLVKWNKRDLRRSFGQHNSDSGSDLSSEMEMIDQLTQVLHHHNINDIDQNVDEAQFNDQLLTPELEDCIRELRVVLGDDVDQDELIRIGLAADYDVNRALNFYFNIEQ